MSIHSQPSPLAGQTVKVATPAWNKGEPVEYRVEDWWDRIAGKSWGVCEGNPACLDYAMRTAIHGPSNLDDEVLYGKVGGFGKLVHVSEVLS